MLTTASSLVLESFRSARRAEQLSHAIAGEVAAVLRVIEMRDYVRGLQSRAESARHGDWQAFQVSAKRNYFPTIEANLDSIGLLPAELPILVPTYLTLAKAALEDLDILGAMTPEDCSVADLALRYDELATMLQEGRAVGRQVVMTVATIYGSPHRRLPIRARLRLARGRVANAFGSSRCTVERSDIGEQ
jgi:hypothetical protein